MLDTTRGTALPVLATWLQHLEERHHKLMESSLWTYWRWEGYRDVYFKDALCERRKVKHYLVTRELMVTECFS
jgi:hypothetical protein